MIAPNYPVLLYAFAYRKSKQNIEEAISWLLDEGENYLLANANEFAKEIKQMQQKWICKQCSSENNGIDNSCPVCNNIKKKDKLPKYIKNMDHVFWTTEKLLSQIEEEENTKKQLLINVLIGELYFGYQNAQIGGITIEQYSKNYLKKLYLNYWNNNIQDIYIIKYLQPKPLPPSANTTSVQTCIRYIFGALLRHYGVISEAMECSEYIIKYGMNKVNKKDHPLLIEVSKLWNIANSCKKDIVYQFKIIEASKDYSSSNKNNNNNPIILLNQNLLKKN